MPTIVDVTIGTVGTTHSVTVVPDPVTIPAGVHGPIQWRITNPASEGWKFQRQGIDIVDPGAEFDHPTEAALGCSHGTTTTRKRDSTSMPSRSRTTRSARNWIPPS
jgi:hypothetical protein